MTAGSPPPTHNPETLAARLAYYAAELPHREAFVDRDTRLSWVELDRDSGALADAFVAEGLTSRDVVLLQLPNGTMALRLRFALARAGMLGAFVPLQWRAAEIAAACDRARPAAVVVPRSSTGPDLLAAYAAFRTRFPGFKVFSVGPIDPRADAQIEQMLEHSPARGRDVPQGFAPDETSWLLTSSGSTGLPKVIAWQEAAQLRTAATGVRDMALSDRDVVGVFAPLSGYAGLYASLWALAQPMRTVLATEFAPEHLLALIERERITVVSLVPPVLVRMLESGLASNFDLSTLRAVRVGTAQFAPTLRAAAEQALGCKVLAAAGSMETGVFAQCRPSDPPQLRLSPAAGRPPDGTACLVVDDCGAALAPEEVGELIVRSAIGASGYFRDPEATEAAWNGPGRAGWYHTGDLATLSATGELTLVGRKKDIINRGGNKILPREVERILLQHPSVADCAVAAVPDSVMGEVPCAWIVQRGPARTDAEALRQCLLVSGLATYKVPAYFVTVDELPLLGNGKVDIRALVTRFTEKPARATGCVSGSPSRPNDS